MDDLIPFLVFLVIALINLGKFLLERKFKENEPPAENPEADEPGAAGLEGFFQELARKLDPNEKPVDLPDWPEGYEKPDYAAEQAAFEQYQQQKEEIEPVFKPAAATAEVIPMPQPAPKAITMERVEAISLRSAMNAIPAMKSTFSSGMVFAPILKSGRAGSIDFPLQHKAAQRKAVLAKVVLDPPRAFDRVFENTARH